MAQILKEEDLGLAESPAILSGTDETPPHPALRPSLTEVPVTPGIHLGEYDSRTSSDMSGYFSGNPALVGGRRGVPQSPSEAAEGATSGSELLRRLSLSSKAGSTRGRGDSIAVDNDPRASYPDLGLTGNIISATFAIPHSLKFRKGADWVSIPNQSSSSRY